MKQYNQRQWELEKCRKMRGITGEKKYRTGVISSHLHTNPSMLFPILLLVLQTAVLDKLALATRLSHNSVISRLDAALRTLTAASGYRRWLLVKAHVALNPITHLACADSAPKLSSPFDLEYGSGF